MSTDLGKGKGGGGGGGGCITDGVMVYLSEFTVTMCPQMLRWGGGGGGGAVLLMV